MFRRVDGDGRRRPTSAGPRRWPTLFGTRIDVDGPSLTRVQQLYLLMLVLLVIFALLGTQPRPVAHRPGLRRDPRPGHRRRGDRGQPHPVQGDRVRGLLVLRRGRRRAAVRHPADVHRPGNFNLLMSVQFIAMILIGGVGNDFRVDHGRAVHHAAAAHHLANCRPCCRSSAPARPVEGSPSFRSRSILYGLLIIGFLLFEPRGLFGIWIRIRNYWKAWPFSY